LNDDDDDDDYEIGNSPGYRIQGGWQLPLLRTRKRRKIPKKIKQSHNTPMEAQVERIYSS
jgi:hypothetical protein